MRPPTARRLLVELEMRFGQLTQALHEPGHDAQACHAAEAGFQQP